MNSGAKTGFSFRLLKSLAFTLSAGWKSCLIWAIFSGMFLSCARLNQGAMELIEVLVNCFIVALSPALFCLFEGWQLSQDLIAAHNSSLGQVFYKHTLAAGIPTILYILKVGEDLKKEALEKAERRLKLDTDEELDFKTEAKPFWQPFMQELLLLSLIFMAILPFQANLLSAPTKMLGNLHLLNQLSLQKRSPGDYCENINIAVTYSSLGKHEDAMKSLASMLPYAMHDMDRGLGIQSIERIYSALSKIDPKNELTAEQWQNLVRPFHDQFNYMLTNNKTNLPGRVVRLTDCFGNPPADASVLVPTCLEIMAKSLAAAYARHNCINEVLCMSLQEETIREHANTPFMRTIEYIREADRSDDALVAFKIARAELETQGQEGPKNVQAREPAELVCHRFIETLSNRMENKPNWDKAAAEEAGAENIEAIEAKIGLLQEAEKKAMADGDLVVARDARRELAQIYSKEPHQNWEQAQYYLTLVYEMENAVPSTPGQQLDDLMSAVKACRRNLDMRQAASFQQEVLRTKEKIYGIDETYRSKARDYALLGQLWQAARQPSKALEAFQKAWEIDKDDNSLPLQAKNVYLSNLLLLTDTAGRPDLVAQYKDQLDKNLVTIYNGHPLKQANPITKPHVDPRENILDPLYWLLLDQDKQLALLE